MQGISIVLQRDFHELRQTAAFRIMLIVSAAVTIAGAAGIGIALSRQEWLGDESAVPVLELIMSLVAYFFPLFILMAFIWAFASLPVVKEKSSGNVESLLATPLSPQSIWVGKVLSIFIPGLAISIAASLAVVLAVNLVVIRPAAGEFILPAPALVTGFLINPLLFSGLLSFIVLFSLANNPEVAIAPSFLVGFGLMIGIPLGLATGVFNLASWSFTLWYLAGPVIIWAVVGYLTRLLTRENIVLSSKG